MAGERECGIRQRGDIRLEDGRLVLYKEGERFGQILIGEDGLYFDGFEPIFCQQDDPVKIRLASRGANVGGEVTFNRLRADDKQEELVRISGQRADDAGSNDYGQCIISIRDRGAPDPNGDYDWKRVFVATSHRLGVMWTGLCNYIGNMGGFANDTDPPAVAPPPAGTHSELWSQDRAYLAVQQADGNFVVYRVGPNGIPTIALWDRWSAEASADGG